LDGGAVFGLEARVTGDEADGVGAVALALAVVVSWVLGVLV